MPTAGAGLVSLNFHGYLTWACKAACNRCNMYTVQHAHVHSNDLTTSADPACKDGLSAAGLHWHTVAVCRTLCAAHPENFQQEPLWLAERGQACGARLPLCGLQLIPESGLPACGRAQGRLGPPREPSPPAPPVLKPERPSVLACMRTLTTVSSVLNTRCCCSMPYGPCLKGQTYLGFWGVCSSILAAH